MPWRDQVSLLFFIEISNSVIGHILSFSKLPFRNPTQSMLGLSTTVTQCGPWIPIFYAVALILSDALLSFSILFRNSSSKWQASPTSLSLSSPRSWPWNFYLVISMTSWTEFLTIYFTHLSYYNYQKCWTEFLSPSLQEMPDPCIFF